MKIEMLKKHSIPEEGELEDSSWMLAATDIAILALASHFRLSASGAAALLLLLLLWRRPGKAFGFEVVLTKQTLCWTSRARGLAEKAIAG